MPFPEDHPKDPEDCLSIFYTSSQGLFSDKSQALLAIIMDVSYRNFPISPAEFLPASAGKGKISTKCCLLRPLPDLASLWLQNSARALEMKCNLQCYQLLQSTAAIHTEKLWAPPRSPGTWYATAATHPKWQGGKETRVESSGHETSVPRKDLKYRFSPLNNHFTNGRQGTMYLGVEF